MGSKYNFGLIHDNLTRKEGILRDIINKNLTLKKKEENAILSEQKSAKEVIYDRLNSYDIESNSVNLLFGDHKIFVNRIFPFYSLKRNKKTVDTYQFPEILDVNRTEIIGATKIINNYGNLKKYNENTKTKKDLIKHWNNIKSSKQQSIGKYFGEKESENFENSKEYSSNFFKKKNKININTIVNEFFNGVQMIQ